MVEFDDACTEVSFNIKFSLLGLQNNLKIIKCISDQSDKEKSPKKK